MPAKIDIKGKQFHRLKVLGESGRDQSGQILWKCECSCKNICYVRGRDLRSGNTKSCGCLNLEMASGRIRKLTVDHSNPAAIRTQKLSPRNTSGIRGVCPTKRGYWKAYIGYKGQYIYLGEYANIEDAAAARKAGEEKYHKLVLACTEREREI